MSKKPSGSRTPESDRPRRKLRSRQPRRRSSEARGRDQTDLRSLGKLADSPLATLEIGADEAAAIDGLVLPVELLEKVEEASARVRETRELLERAIERADQIKPEIHQRVTSDYRARLEELEANYDPLEAEVLERLSSIRHEGIGLRDALSVIGDQAEEIRFRHEVGEFSDAELAERVEALDVDRREIMLKVELCDSAFEDARRVLLVDPESLLDGRGEVPDGTSETSRPASFTADADPGSESTGATWDDDATAITQLGDEPESLDLGVDSASDTTAAMEEELPGVVLPEPIDKAGARGNAAIAKPDGPALAPVTSAKFARLVRTRPDGESWTLEGGAVRLGRSRRNDVVIPGQTVSREHAIIRPYGEGHQIENVSSSAGVLINGEPRVRANLEPGDQILIGSWLFEYRSADHGV